MRNINKTNYTIIAGVNGSGKSTLYCSNRIKEKNLGVRINSDELIYRKYQNNWQDSDIQKKAGRETVRTIKHCLNNNISLNQETTLTGNTILKNVKEAKEKGYKINLYYIGLSSYELAIERVANRVQKGGHSISDETIMRRYSNSLKNLEKILPICDSFYLFDNSIDFKSILLMKDKKITLKSQIPEYIKPYINDCLEALKVEKTKKPTFNIADLKSKSKAQKQKPNDNINKLGR